MKYLFYISIIIIAAFLAFFAFFKKDRSQAIVAEVETQKTAISFHKPVRIKQLYVAPGQHVKVGDVLLEAERPDLLFDIEKIENEMSMVSAARDKNTTNYESWLKVENLEHRQKTASITNKLQALDNGYETDSVFYSRVSGIVGVDSTNTAANTFRMERTALENDLELEKKRHFSEVERQKQLQIRDDEALQLRRKLLDAERAALEKEQTELKQFAPFDGTVGNISVQLMELIPPYQTIISLYDEYPTLIKGYMNELADIEIAVGDPVFVESVNRTYRIEGEIIEVGSRIVVFPRQMNPLGQIEMWGKEVFVRIPRESEFLNGEKVFVVLNATK